jgi:hypothetical protein
MQKRLAIFLAFFIVFAPIYSNAVLPALAASVASNGGRVLVGQTIKKVSPSALANAKKAAVGICVKYPKLCGGGMGALGLALTADGWNIEITNNDVTNIDVDIYKLPPNDTCELNVAYGKNTAAQPLTTSINSDVSAIFKIRRGDDPAYDYAFSPNTGKSYTDIKAVVLANAPRTLMQEWQLYSHFNFQIYELHTYKAANGSMVTNSNLITQSSSVYYRCMPYPTNKIYITNYELNEYITNNTTNNDIDIKDIYNFDFSQYNINIGGDTYNGTTINNDLSKSDPSEADKKVSPDLKNKLDDKTISLDDVNDQNCTKNYAWEYDKCGDKTDPTDPTDPEEPTDPTDPEPPPIECDANGFYKKVCDWMDWTQEKPSQSPDNSIDIKEVEAENSNKIDMIGQCPAPYQLSFNVLGYEQNHSISYEPLCGALVLLKPIFVGSGALSGMFILMGYSRASNTGVNG